MTLPLPRALHQELLERANTLLVARPAALPPKPSPGQPGTQSDYVQGTPEIFIAVSAEDDLEWRVTAFNGHVDLGTGIRTSLAQIVAEELSIPLSKLDMILGHTGAVPNQGPTIASASIQISAVPLRRAAAQARGYFLSLAASRWHTDESKLDMIDGWVFEGDSANPVHRIQLGELLAGQKKLLTLAASDDAVTFKPVDQYRLVGHKVPRLDLSAKATGALTYVHDVRVPNMVHARVVRPPHPGLDRGDFIGRCLIKVHSDSIAALPGNVRLVIRGDFVAVVADREEQAIAAMNKLEISWRSIPDAPDMSDLEVAIRGNRSVERVLVHDEQIERDWDESQIRIKNTYLWPYQMHASIGPSCAVAHYSENRLTVWAGTQNPHMLRTDLSKLIQIGEQDIEIVRFEASGCYGRNCADDVCADAALIATAIGKPVRVQLTRQQEHQWEPKGTGQLMDVEAGMDGQGNLTAYDFAVRYPSNDAPLLAALLIGAASGDPRTLEMGDRTSVPPYQFKSKHIVCYDGPPIVRASWLRGVSALPNSFAHDCMIDELAFAASEDPLDFRIRHLIDERAKDLIKATAERAQWRGRQPGSAGKADQKDLMHGTGMAYARYVHSKFPGFGAAWACWIVDLTVNRKTGQIQFKRIVVGQDTGMVVNPDGVRHQIHGNVIQTISRTLMEKVMFDVLGVSSREWGTYPIVGFKNIPPIDVVLMGRQDQPPMGGGESASVPGPAAIANALFDALGIRFREAPFTADMVLRKISEPGSRYPTSHSSLPSREDAGPSLKSSLSTTKLDDDPSFESDEVKKAKGKFLSP